MKDEVVISGVGGHFPECDSLQELREKLLRNDHLISDPSGDLQPRYTGGAGSSLEPGSEAPGLDKENLRSGKMRYGDKFDNTFFGMHSRLAAATDSITRHVLETTLEAVIDAGYSPKDLHGSNTAVFMGYHCSESESNFIRESADGFGIMGLNAAMTANRVSYWLDLKGTSFTHNTQLVSGMQGLDMAFRALSKGECDRALVGAASLSYLAELATHYDDLGWLSTSGSCKPFDAAADGGVRSEAVVVMLLERRSTAQRVYAEVVHASSAMCAELSRAELPCLERRVLAHQLNAFYSECGVNPDHIEYLEADGWGVRSVDEAEIGALDDAIASRRTRPLLIGSVKGNIGQVEAASGLAAVCKVLVAMESGTIPATINHVDPSSQLAGVRHGRIQVVTENTPLVHGYVAVNNLGVGGILGHVLLRPNPRAKLPLADATAAAADSPIPKLLLMSGRTPEGLEVVIGTAEQSASDSEYVHLVHRAFSSHIFGHMYRGYSLVPKADEQVKAPTKFYTGQTRPIWFVYSGMGSQWPGMGADLMRIPVFAAAVERCHNALLPLGLDLKHIITTKDPKIYDNILHSFVGIAAVQVGLTDVLHAVGIEPYGIIGHSVGELGCAYADGCITAEQMMLAAHARGQASNETELVPGMMAAVGMGYKDIKDMVPEAIEVACHNSATSCTLSGPTADLDAFVAELKAKGIFARTVNVSNIAYHSRYIKPAAPRLLQLLQGVLKEPRARSPRWISTSVRPATKKGPDTTRASAEYFTNNLLSSVYFEEGTDQMDKDALAIEIAPHGLLQAILKRSLSQDAVNVAMTKRDMPGATMVLDALGKMYMEGLNPQVAALYPSVETPVCRGTATLAPLATWDHRDSWPVAFLKAPPESGPRTELHLPLSLTTDEFAHLSDCKWNGHSLLTPGTILNLVLSIVFSSASKDKPIVLENVVFLKSVVVPEDGSDEVYVFVQRGSGRFEVSVKERMVATGTVTVVEDADRERQCLDRPPSTVPREERVAHGADYIYEELGRRGLRCHGHFRGLLQLQRGARAVLATVADSADRGTQLDAILQMVTLQRSEGRHELHHARRIQRIVIDPTKALPAGSEQALHFDPAHHSIRLASSSGQVDVVLVETRALPLAPTYAPILVQGKTFLPYGSRDAVKDLLHLASLSLQLAANQGRLPLQVAAIGVPDSSRALLDAVLFVAEQQLPDLHVKVTVDGGSEGAALLLSDASDLQGALTAVRRQRGMLLARLPAGFAPPAELHELLALDVGRVRYALLKHTADVDPNSEVLHAGEGGELPQQRLALAQGAVVYLVFRGVHTQRIPGMVRAVASVPAGNRAHCVFLQDAAAPSFDLRGPQYAAQLRLGLRVNVLQGGRWGGVHRVHFANLSAGAPGSDSLTRTRQLAMDGMQLQYLGVNPYSDSVEDARTAVGLLDYAARRADGQRVMGVCSSSAGPLHPDPVLSWPVPQGWSDEDAGTVPLAYATALYVIHEQLAVRAGERALVVGGTTALGQAAITLLLAMKCPVFATVRDQHEHAELRDRFPSPSLDVLVGSVEEYTRELRRRSRGLSCVDVVLCQGAPSEVKAAMTILKKYGRTAHVGADHSLLSENLGLGSFITSTALFSLGWNWPLTARADDKARVRDAMLTAIQQGAVRPLPRRTAPPQALAESQRRAVEGAGKVLLSMKGEVFRTPSTLDPNCSCLVVGGPTARAVSVSEWLLSSGARDVSVSASLGGRAAGSAWLGRRLALMAAHYGAAVRTLPPGDIQQAVRAAAQVSPLGLVMALAQQPDRVRALDAATRTAGCTLVVLAEGAQLRQDDLDELGALVRCRREQGYSGVLATLGDLADDVRLLPLDQVLRSASNPVTHSVDVLQLKPSSDIEVTEGASAALPMLLPSSAEALRRLGLSQPASVTQRVLPSLIGGPADRRNKEVPPVFLVGGLSDAAVHELGPLALQLMATAVVVTPATGAASVEEAAEDVVSAVLRTQPLGPYTVAGRGWGGLVALEAVRALVRRKGCHATAFLLDASPDALQAALSPLRNQPSGLPTALLKYLLKLDCEAEELVYRAPDWSTRMQLALGGRDSVLESVLTCLLQRVQSIVNYSPAALDSKVGVSLVSDHRHHLQSAILSEISTSVRAHPLPALEDEAVRNKQCASVLSAGVHVGRSTMMERRALASLTVVF